MTARMGSFATPQLLALGDDLAPETVRAAEATIDAHAESAREATELKAMLGIGPNGLDVWK